VARPAAAAGVRTRDARADELEAIETELKTRARNAPGCLLARMKHDLGDR